mmetsp:Transcript_21400/g.55732  ORF Transcript_21400/g.55732 Transcript_21400/m.55732 type:complete len:122 (-) Transcript_21400:1-366(-)
MVRAQEARQRVGAGHSAVAVSEAAAALPASTRQTVLPTSPQGKQGKGEFQRCKPKVGQPNRLPSPESQHTLPATLQRRSPGCEAWKQKLRGRRSKFANKCGWPSKYCLRAWNDTINNAFYS